MLTPPPLRSSQPAADVDGFFNAVAEALKLHSQTTGVPAGAEPTLVHSFPSERLKGADQAFNVITHHVMEAKTAATSNDGSRIPMIKPVLRERKAHPDKDGYALLTFGWTEEVAVIFTVYSRANDTADQLATWFHKFMVKYAFLKYFEARGVQHMRFIARLEDDTETRDDQELHRRRLCYSFRVEYLDNYEEKLLQSLTTTIDIAHRAQ